MFHFYLNIKLHTLKLVIWFWGGSSIKWTQLPYIQNLNGMVSIENTFSAHQWKQKWTECACSHSGPENLPETENVIESPCGLCYSQGALLGPSCFISCFSSFIYKKEITTELSKLNYWNSISNIVKNKYNFDSF